MPVSYPTSGVKAERIERTAEMKGVAYDRKQTEQK